MTEMMEMMRGRHKGQAMPSQQQQQPQQQQLTAAAAAAAAAAAGAGGMLAGVIPVLLLLMMMHDKGTARSLRDWAVEIMMMMIMMMMAWDGSNHECEGLRESRGTER
jgi:hypothetical protein